MNPNQAKLEVPLCVSAVRSSPLGARNLKAPRHEPGAPWSLAPVPALPSPTVQTHQGPCVPHTALPSWTGASCFQAIPHRASGITSWVIPQIVRLPRQPASCHPSLGGPRVLPQSPRPPSAQPPPAQPWASAIERWPFAVPSAQRAVPASRTRPVSPLQGATVGRGLGAVLPSPALASFVGTARCVCASACKGVIPSFFPSV